MSSNPLIRIYINQRQNKITFRTKPGYYLELLTLETMKLFRSTKSNIAKDENGENCPCLEISEVVLVHCSNVDNDYQLDSRVLYTFVPNKLLGQLLDISPTNLIFLKTSCSEFSYSGCGLPISVIY